MSRPFRRNRREGRLLDRSTAPALGTLVLMAGLAALSTNVFLPSLTAIAADFGTQYQVMQFAITGYLAVTAVLQLLTGPLSDRFGRRPVALGACVLFMLATIGCLLAQSAATFLAFRMMQALVVANMVLSRAIIRDITPDSDHAASRIGYVTMGMAVVPMIGPGIGGLLDQAFGWRAAFVLLLVAGAAVTWLIWADLGETLQRPLADRSTRRADMGALARSRRFWLYGLAAALNGAAFFSYVGAAPYIAGVLYGMGPAATGGYFGLVAIGYMVGNFLSGRYSGRIGTDRMILGGTLVALAGVLASMLTSLSGLATATTFFGLMLPVGLGNGMVLPNATAGMMSVRPSLAGTASGVGGAMMIGMGAGVAALAAALLNPERGAYPLLVIQLVSLIASVWAVGALLRRNRQTQV